MATKIFLKKDSNQSVATLPNWTGVADIFGAAGGNEVVNIHVGNSDLSSFSASAMTLDQNIEGVYLSQAIGNYQFAANGNEVSIKLGGVVIAKVTVQDDTDGTAITYAGQTTPLALIIAAASNGFAVQLGDQVLTSTPAAYGETPNPSTGSTEQAPWTLVMGASGYDYTTYTNYNNTFVSDGTADGTGVTIATKNAAMVYSSNGELLSGYKLDESKTQVYWIGNKINASDYTFWGLSAANLTPVNLLDVSYDSPIRHVTGSELFQFSNYSVFARANAILATDGTATNTFSLDLSGGTILQVDSANNAIWHTMTTAPYGTELYKTVLSDTGFTTTMVKDIYAGSGSGLGRTYYDGIPSAVLADGKIVFGAYNGTQGYKTYVSDGTEVGTYVLSDYSYESSSNFYKLFNGKAVYSIYVENHTLGALGQELVFSDGTTSGTKVLDVYAGSSSSNPTILGTINDKLYFTATDANGLGLFSTDGTTFSKLVAISDSNAQILGYTANKAYFAITDSANGKELWAADLIATTPSLTLVKDILAGSGSGLAGINTYDASSMPTMIGDKILFNAYTSGTNQALFVSDGTETGTVQLATSLPTDKAIIGNKVFFANSTGVSVADVSATSVGATELKAGDFSSQTYGVDRLQSDSDQAFFLAADEKLYVSTGTDTIELANNVDKFKVVAEDAIYFIATNSSNVASLWYSDGTASGTRYIEDLTLSANSYDLANAVAIHTVGVSPI